MAEASATKLQSMWRGHKLRRALEYQLCEIIAPPSMKVSRAAQTAALPRDQNGQLLPICCSIECFKAFGAGVYAYMKWQRFMVTVFLIAFAFALPNMIHNSFGEMLTSPSWLTLHSLGNVAGLNASYGVVELLVCATFTVALFYGQKLIQDAEGVRSSAVATCTRGATAVDGLRGARSGACSC